MINKIIKLVFILALFICLNGCGKSGNLPNLEMIHVSKAYTNDDGFPVIDFQITNSEKTPICVPVSIFEGSNSYYAILDIKTKNGRLLKEKESNGRPNIGTRKLLRIAPDGKKSNTITIGREFFRKQLREKSELTVEFKFWGGFCTSDLEPTAKPDFFAVSNRVMIQ